MSSLTDLHQALRGISAVNRASPTPLQFLGFVDVMIVITDSILTVKKNKVEFKALAQRAGTLAKSLADAINEQAQQGPIPEELDRNVNAFLRILNPMKDIALEAAGRSIWHRWFHSDRDLASIEDYQSQLDNYQRDFNVVSGAATQATVHRIEKAVKNLPSHGPATNINTGAAHQGHITLGNRAEIRVGDVAIEDTGDTFHSVYGGNIGGRNNTNTLHSVMNFA